MKVFGSVLTICLLIVLLICINRQRKYTDILPVLLLTTLQGKATTKLLARRPAIIYFWASWCGICHSIQGTIDELLQDYAGITVALGSGNDQTISGYLQSNKLDWQVINDNSGKLAQTYGVHAVPTVFIIGSNGKIRFVSLGYLTKIGLRIRIWWVESAIFGS